MYILEGRFLYIDQNFNMLLNSVNTFNILYYLLIINGIVTNNTKIIDRNIFSCMASSVAVYTTNQSVIECKRHTCKVLLCRNSYNPTWVSPLRNFRRIYLL